MTAHNSIFMGPIKVFGTEEQKQDILPQFVTGTRTLRNSTLPHFKNLHSAHIAIVKNRYTC